MASGIGNVLPDILCIYFLIINLELLSELELLNFQAKTIIKILKWLLIGVYSMPMTLSYFQPQLKVSNPCSTHCLISQSYGSLR